MTRTDEPTSWDERSTLLAMLQYTRDTAAAKCAGISPADASRALLPGSPLMTVGGLVHHLRWVEHSWIENRFIGGPDLGPWTVESPDEEFVQGAVLPLEQVLAEYVEQAARTDAIIAAHDLDDRSVTPLRGTGDHPGEHPTLRWVILHLVEENARHNGHLDLLRELLDGTVGP